MTGDGCSVCNPAKSLEYATQTITDLQNDIACLVDALRGVIRVADRATVEFDAARAAIQQATGEQA
jgi:hypothetical protein